MGIVQINSTSLYYPKKYSVFLFHTSKPFATLNQKEYLLIELQNYLGFKDFCPEQVDLDLKVNYESGHYKKVLQNACLIC